MHTGGWCALLENYSTQCTIIPEYKSGEIHIGEMDVMEMGEGRFRLLLYILINSIGAVQIRYRTWRGGVSTKSEEVWGGGFMEK